ncbi:MAG: N-6 DNA methylase [Chitinophagaceae bacterium]
MAKSKADEKEKTLESWLWDAACAIRGAQDAPKYKDFILPLVFVKRLCDVFDDEVNKMKEEVGSRKRALGLIDKDHKLVRFYLPIRANDVENDDTWSVIKLLQAKEKESIGQQLTDIMRGIAKENARIQGIIDRIDYNATTHGQRDMDDDQISLLINRISEKRLGLKDVEPDILGRSYEYLIRKFAEGGGQSAGEFYTPKEVGFVMARILDPEAGMEAYDPNCGSAGLLIKMELVLEEKMEMRSKTKYAPLKLYGQEYTSATWAMANMNMVIHEMEGEIAIGNTMTKPDRFDFKGKGLKAFDLVTANPMWNQKSFVQDIYENDELNRFANRFPDNAVVPFPPSDSADWAWAQHILSSMKPNGRAAIVLDTGAVSRGSGSKSKDREKVIRQWFVEEDLIEGVLYLPENLFYNTSAPGIVLFLNKNKPKQLKEKFILINASRDFTKGDPKNYLSDEAIEKIVNTYKELFAEGKGKAEKFAMIATKAEIEKNDYNISPSRYIHTADATEHRGIAELVDELKNLNNSAKDIDRELKTVLEKIGY